MLHQVGFAYTRWTKHNHILFLILDPIRSFTMLLLVRTHVLGMIVMITYGNGESLFSLILSNHKTIKMSFDVTRFVIKIKNFIGTIYLWRFTRFRLRFRRHITL